MNNSTAQSNRATWNKSNYQTRASQKPTQTGNNYPVKTQRQIWNKQRYQTQQSEDESQIHLQTERFQQQKFHLTSLNDISALKSQDFTVDNPLLSNSKMWKHSPIRNEESLLSEDGQALLNESSLCSFRSPQKGELNEDANCEESIQESPMPKIQMIPNSQGFNNKKETHQAQKISGLTNFHNNYLRLGLWPELSYSKQAFLRNSFKNNLSFNNQVINNQTSRTKLLDFNLSSVQYLQTSMANFPTIAQAEKIANQPNHQLPPTSSNIDIG